jgi:hypothetical protein
VGVGQMGSSVINKRDEMMNDKKYFENHMMGVRGNLKLAFSWRFETEHISRLASSSN